MTIIVFQGLNSSSNIFENDPSERNFSLTISVGINGTHSNSHYSSWNQSSNSFEYVISSNNITKTFEMILNASYSPTHFSASINGNYGYNSDKSQLENTIDFKLDVDAHFSPNLIHDFLDHGNMTVYNDNGAKVLETNGSTATIFID